MNSVTYEWMHATAPASTGNALFPFVAPEAPQHLEAERVDWNDYFAQRMHPHWFQTQSGIKVANYALLALTTALGCGATWVYYRFTARPETIIRVFNTVLRGACVAGALTVLSFVRRAFPFEKDPAVSARKAQNVLNTPFDVSWKKHFDSETLDKLLASDVREMTACAFLEKHGSRALICLNEENLQHMRGKYVSERLHSERGALTDKDVRDFAAMHPSKEEWKQFVLFQAHLLEEQKIGYHQFRVFAQQCNRSFGEVFEPHQKQFIKEKLIAYCDQKQCGLLEVGRLYTSDMKWCDAQLSDFIDLAHKDIFLSYRDFVEKHGVAGLELLKERGCLSREQLDRFAQQFLDGADVSHGLEHAQRGYSREIACLQVEEQFKERVLLSELEQMKRLALDYAQFEERNGVEGTAWLSNYCVDHHVELQNVFMTWSYDALKSFQLANPGAMPDDAMVRIVDGDASTMPYAQFIKKHGFKPIQDGVVQDVRHLQSTIELDVAGLLAQDPLAFTTRLINDQVPQVRWCVRQFAADHLEEIVQRTSDEHQQYEALRRKGLVPKSLDDIVTEVGDELRMRDDWHKRQMYRAQAAHNMQVDFIVDDPRYNARDEDTIIKNYARDIAACEERIKVLREEMEDVKLNLPEAVEGEVQQSERREAELLGQLSELLPLLDMSRRENLEQALEQQKKERDALASTTVTGMAAAREADKKRVQLDQKIGLLEHGLEQMKNAPTEAVKLEDAYHKTQEETRHYKFSVPIAMVRENNTQRRLNELHAEIRDIEAQRDRLCEAREGFQQRKLKILRKRDEHLNRENMRFSAEYDALNGELARGRASCLQQASRRIFALR